MVEMLLPEPRSDWPGALLEIARRTHALYLRHPWALVAMRTVPPGPNAMRHVEQCLEALAETRLDASEKMTLLALVDDFVFGHALRSAERDVAVDLDLAKAQIATGRFPRLEETFASGRVVPGGDRFERGLRAMIAAVVPEKRARRRSADPAHVRVRR
jgi:hypothetical protein